MKSNYLAEQLALYVFNGEVPEFTLDTHFFLSMHTKDPGRGGLQSSFECSYSGYKRIKTGRTKDSWLVKVEEDETFITNTYKLYLPIAQEDTKEKVKYLSIGRAEVGDSKILYIGELEEEIIIIMNREFSIPINGAKLIE